MSARIQHEMANHFGWTGANRLVHHELVFFQTSMLVEMMGLTPDDEVEFYFGFCVALVVGARRIYDKEYDFSFVLCISDRFGSVLIPFVSPDAACLAASCSRCVPLVFLACHPTQTLSFHMDVM